MKDLESKGYQEDINPYAGDLEGVKQSLMPSVEKNGQYGTWLTDLDDTVKEAQKYEWPDGKLRRVLPETVAALRTLHVIGIPLGIVTEQSFAEMQPWLLDVTNLVLYTENADLYTVFNSLIVGEGGNVIKKPGKGKTERVVAPPGARKERKKLLTWLSLPGTITSSDEGSWGILDDVDPEEGTYVELPIGENQGLATVSLWEKGQHISQDPGAIYKYDKVKQRIDKAFVEQKISKLTSYEAGNGTLRIVPTYVNKCHTMEILKTVGLFDPRYAVYSCDGPNDVGLAKYLKKNGGKVIAVGNAVDELKLVSDHNPKGHAGLGFAQTVQEMFPEEYNASLQAVHKEAFVRKFADDLIQVSPDLRSNNLAFSQAEALFEKLSQMNAHTELELIAAGKEVWHTIGKDVLGPLMVCFVDQALQKIPPGGIAIFPARDATPFFHIAKKLQALNSSYENIKIINPVFNRKLWGVEDEQDPENGVSSIHDPAIQKLLSQMGIGSTRPVSFIEVGAYGTMVRALKEGGYHDFGVQFFFSQVPFIQGFINTNIDDLQLPPGAEETIADSLEGLPKPYKRPTKVIQDPDGAVTVSWEGKKVASPFLEPWQGMFFKGLEEATNEYSLYKQEKGELFDMEAYKKEQIMKLAHLSQHTARTGEFTGLLPQHTESWSEKQEWIDTWFKDFGTSKVPFVGGVQQ